MIGKRLYGLIAFLLLLFTSCEKVIELEIKDAEQQVIVEGVLKDHPGDNHILLSRSGGIYENSDFEKISGATVTVTSGAGTIYFFTEDSAQPGRYTHPTFQASPHEVYDLWVDMGEMIVTAKSQTFSKPQVDSMTFISQVFGGGGIQVDTHHLVSYHSVDPAGEKNQYRVRFYINNKEVDFFYLGNDDFIDGQYYEAPFYGAVTNPGDTVFMEIISMDEAVYRYFYQLANNLDQTPFSATPANPVTNLEGGAIGYFGVFMTDTMSMVLP